MLSFYLTFVLLGILCLSALYLAAEYALVKLRSSNLSRDLLQDQDPEGQLTRKVEDIDLYLPGLRFFTNVFTILIFPVSALWIKALAETALFAFPQPVLWILSLVVAGYLRFSTGEIIGRSLGLQHPMLVLGKLSFLLRTARWADPFVRFAQIPAFLFRKWISVAPENNQEFPDFVQQAKSLQEDDGQLTGTFRKILGNVVAMRDLVVSDILLPRNQVKYFDLNLPVDENLLLARKTGHTRFPLCPGDLDDCIGIIHIKDLFRKNPHPGDVDFQALKRPLIEVGLEDPLDITLQKLLRLQSHMALVRDEFGACVGIVTLENIVEQFIGDIKDEFDHDENRIRKNGPGSYLIDGLVPLHEIEAQLGVSFPKADVSTIGGLIISILDRIPAKGEILNQPGFHLQVQEVNERRIISVLLKAHEDPQPSP